MYNKPCGNDHAVIPAFFCVQLVLLKKAFPLEESAERSEAIEGTASPTQDQVRKSHPGALLSSAPPSQPPYFYDEYAACIFCF